MLTEAAPIRSLPTGVIHQLVRYYGDWRRSRDLLNVLNDAEESTGSETVPVFLSSGRHFGNPSRSLSPR